MNIVYWSDYACPFCYIGETNLKNAAKELGVDLDIEMKAFELDPQAAQKSDTNVVDGLAKKYQVSTEQALDNINSMSIMAKEAGIENFDYSKAKPSNTFNAHRLTKLAQELGKDNEIAEKLFEAYFTEQKELADIDTLINIAKEVGIEEEAVNELINSDKYAEEVRIDELVAQNNGIHAVPFFIVDGKYGIPGALPVEQMKQVLTEAMNS